MDDLQVIEIAVDRYAVAAFLGYLLLIIGLGIYSARFSSRGISEFFIGGRKMNRFVVALSAVVSGRSAWLLAGVIAGLIAGTCTTMVWYFVPELRAIVYELIPGFAAGFLATVVVSLFTQVPDDAEQQIMDMKG